MIDGDEAGERFSLVEHPMPPRALAAPLHRHTREDEYSYVLEGRMGALLGDEVVEAGPGRPRLQAAQPVAHVLERRRRAVPDPRDHLPGRLRAVLRRARRHSAARSRPSPEALGELCARYGLEMQPETRPRAARALRPAARRAALRRLDAPGALSDAGRQVLRDVPAHEDAEPARPRRARSGTRASGRARAPARWPRRRPAPSGCSRARGALVDRGLHERAAEPAAAGLRAHEQVLERAVLRVPPDAVAVAQPGDARRRLVLASRQLAVARGRSADRRRRGSWPRAASRWPR